MFQETHNSLNVKSPGHLNFGQETERSPVCMARHAGSRIAVDRPDGRAADGIILLSSNIQLVAG